MKRKVFYVLMLILLVNFTACTAKGESKADREKRQQKEREIHDQLWQDALAAGQSENDFKIKQNAEGGITITGYQGTATELVIPATIEGIAVTKIALDVFNKKKLTSVAIPNGITYLPGAFYSNQLTSITIPANVDFSRVNGAFRNGFDAAYIRIGRQGGTYTRRSEHVKTGWSSNTPNYMGWGFKSDDYMYLSSLSGEVIITDYLGSDKTVIIPATINGMPVTSIGYDAFKFNPVTSITIPSRVTYVSKNAFINNPLTSITIPANVNYAESFPNNFTAFYESQKKKAGTYTWSGRIWSVR